MRILKSVSELMEFSRTSQRPVGLVPTMGALHEGHMSLVRQSQLDNATSIVSIFVNPMQFASERDLAQYPRSLELDLVSLERLQVAGVYLPSVDEMYPAGHATFVDIKGPAMTLEGKKRPGHFRGVATVVMKLLFSSLPDRCYFGCKDAQQLAVIRRLAVDMNIPTQIVGLPTVREDNGLAISSRNGLLSDYERESASVIYKALGTSKQMYDQGNRKVGDLINVCREILAADSVITSIDYVAIVDPVTFHQLRSIGEDVSLLLVAVNIGPVRLIDNVRLQGVSSESFLDDNL